MLPESHNIHTYVYKGVTQIAYNDAQYMCNVYTSRLNYGAVVSASRRHYGDAQRLKVEERILIDKF